MFRKLAIVQLRIADRGYMGSLAHVRMYVQIVFIVNSTGVIYLCLRTFIRSPVSGLGPVTAISSSISSCFSSWVVTHCNQCACPKAA